MSITIENAEVEALLADLTQTTRRSAPDLLLDLLHRERERIDGEAERRIAEGLAADEAMRRRLAASERVDPRPIDEILAWDEHGLPVRSSSTHRPSSRSSARSPKPKASPV